MKSTKDAKGAPRPLNLQIAPRKIASRSSPSRFVDETTDLSDVETLLKLLHVRIGVEDSTAEGVGDSPDVEAVTTRGCAAAVGYIFQVVVNPTTLWGLRGGRFLLRQSMFSSESAKNSLFRNTYPKVLIDILLTPIGMITPNAIFAPTSRAIHWSAWLVYQYLVYKLATKVLYDLGINYQWFETVLLWDHTIPPLLFSTAVAHLKDMAHEEISESLDDVKKQLDRFDLFATIGKTFDSAHDHAMAWLLNNWDPVKRVCLENVEKWTGWEFTTKPKAIAPLSVGDLDAIVQELEALAEKKYVDHVFVKRVKRYVDNIKKIDKRTSKALAPSSSQGQGGRIDLGLNADPVLRNTVKEQMVLDTEALQIILMQKLVGEQTRYEVGFSPIELDALLSRVKAVGNARTVREVSNGAMQILRNKDGMRDAVVRDTVRGFIQYVYPDAFNNTEQRGDVTRENMLALTSGKPPTMKQIGGASKDEDESGRLLHEKADRDLRDLNETILGELVMSATKNATRNATGNATGNAAGLEWLTNLLTNIFWTSGPGMLTNGTAMLTNGTIGAGEDDPTHATCEDPMRVLERFFAAGAY